MPSAQQLMSQPLPLPLATMPNDKIGRLPDQAGDPDQQPQDPATNKDEPRNEYQTQSVTNHQGFQPNPGAFAG